jgi:hypothetical protein
LRILLNLSPARSDDTIAYLWRSFHEIACSHRGCRFMIQNPHRLLAAVLLTMGAGRATAQPIAPSPYPAVPSCADLSVQYKGSVDADLPCAACAPDWFATERFSYEVLVGDYAATSAIGPGAPFDPANPTTKKQSVDIDYIPIDLRLGYRPFLPARRGGPRWCEQWILLLDLEIAPIAHGAGNVIIGPGAILRYDFLPASSELIPYIQGGAWGVYNDEYKDLNQRALGEAFEFQEGVQAGLRWRFADNWSVEIEGGYEHISNADLAPRNAGLNSLGGSLGFAYTFGASCRH